jgi:hypothetical protein
MSLVPIPYFGEETELLCEGLISFALAEPAITQETASYFETEKCLIEQQAASFYQDPDLALAFSILYSFTLVQLGPKFPERSTQLANRAFDLHLILRTTKEICPTDDPFEFLQFVNNYAEDLLSDKPNTTVQ